MNTNYKRLQPGMIRSSIKLTRFYGAYQCYIGDLHFRICEIEFERIKLLIEQKRDYLFYYIGLNCEIKVSVNINEIPDEQTNNDYQKLISMNHINMKCHPLDQLEIGSTNVTQNDLSDLLYDWQKTSVIHLLENENSHIISRKDMMKKEQPLTRSHMDFSILAEPQSSGKTYIIAGFLQVLNENNNLLVIPKHLKDHWTTILKQFHVDYCIIVDKQVPPKNKVSIVTFDKLYNIDLSPIYWNRVIIDNMNDFLCCFEEKLIWFNSKRYLYITDDDLSIYEHFQKKKIDVTHSQTCLMSVQNFHFDHHTFYKQIEKRIKYHDFEVLYSERSKTSDVLDVRVADLLNNDHGSYWRLISDRMNSPYHVKNAQQIIENEQLGQHAMKIIISMQDTIEDCSICLSEIKDMVTILQCGHYFCDNCLKHVHRCPLCRKSIERPLKMDCRESPYVHSNMDVDYYKLAVRYGSLIASTFLLAQKLDGKVLITDYMIRIKDSVEMIFKDQGIPLAVYDVPQNYCSHNFIDQMDYKVHLNCFYNDADGIHMDFDHIIIVNDYCIDSFFIAMRNCQLNQNVQIHQLKGSFK